MECPECQQSLMVASSKYESDKDSTEVYSVLTMVCINPKCDNYSGPNLNEPKKIANVVRKKVN